MVRDRLVRSQAGTDRSQRAAARRPLSVDTDCSRLGAQAARCAGIGGVSASTRTQPASMQTSASVTTSRATGCSPPPSGGRSSRASPTRRAARARQDDQRLRRALAVRASARTGAQPSRHHPQQLTHLLPSARQPTAGRRPGRQTVVTPGGREVSTVWRAQAVSICSPGMCVCLGGGAGLKGGGGRGGR
jgi:hypothetical protein